MENKNDATLDIVKLIEKNPITRLSKDYQNDLIDKIKEKFTGNEQHMFVGNFFCYLNYSETDFVIDLEDVWKWAGFSRKDPAKVVIKNNFIEDIDYKIVFQTSMENSKGGRPKEQCLMTVDTFKNFCLKAGTKKADEIHRYYIKLEKLLHETIDQETSDLRNQLQIQDNQLQTKREQMKNLKNQLQKTSKQLELDKKKHKLEVKMNTHNILIEMLKTKKCVYLGEIINADDDAGEYIKIGSSGGIDDRGYSLKRQYGKFIFLEVFECDNFRDVEDSILTHQDVVDHLYKDKINGHSSIEVVKLSENFNYQQLIAIVKKCVSESKMYVFTAEQLLKKQELDLEEKKLEYNMQLERKKLDYNMLLSLSNNKTYEDTIKENLANVFKNIEKNEQKIEEKKIESDEIEDIEDNITDDDDDEDDDDEDDINDRNGGMEVNKRALVKSTKGKKIQKVDPNNLKRVIKVYNGMACVLRDSSNNGFQKTSIQTAAKNNYLYKGFRWNLIKRDEDENVCDLAPTIERQKGREINTIIQLNSTKTKIIDSFGTRTSLMKKLKIGMPKLNSIIENNEKYSDHYYVKLDDCPQNLLDKYQKPINQFIRKNSKQIKQINPTTKQTLIFNSLADIYRKYGIADSTIVNAIKNKEVYQGFLWEYNQ